MYKHTEVAERLGFSRQALDKHRKQLEQQKGVALGSIVDGARVYTVADLELLREQLPESKQAGIDRILGGIEIAPSIPAEVVTSDPFALKPRSSRFNQFSFESSDVAQLATQQADQVGSEAKQANHNALSQLRQLNRQQAEILGSLIGAEFVESFETAKHKIITDHAKKQGVDAQPQAS